MFFGQQAVSNIAAESRAKIVHESDTLRGVGAGSA